MPALKNVDHTAPDDFTAEAILRYYNPVILKDFQPKQVADDGNCMCRAVSLGMFGTEDFHIYLRLLTALEMAYNPEFYDSDHINFTDLIKDNRIVTSSFEDLLNAALTVGAYSEMADIFAVSAALKFPMQSYFPPLSTAEKLSDAYRCFIYGRGVKKTLSPRCQLMWSCTA